MGSLFWRYAVQFVKMGKAALVSTSQGDSNGLHARKQWLVVKEFLDGESNHVGAVSCPVHANTGIEQGQVLLGDSERNGTGGLAHPGSSCKVRLEQPVYEDNSNDDNLSLLVIQCEFGERRHDWRSFKDESLPTATMSLVPTRGLYLYLETLRVAFDDAIVTDDEAQILHILAQALGVAPADTAECRAVVAGESPSPFDNDTEFGGHHMGDATTYQSALIAALDDDVISEDEWAMLDHLRRIIGLQEDQHALIEESIRAMSEVDEEGQRRIERLERYLTVCTF